MSDRDCLNYNVDLIDTNRDTYGEHTIRLDQTRREGKTSCYHTIGYNDALDLLTRHKNFEYKAYNKFAAEKDSSWTFKITHKTDESIKYGQDGQTFWLGVYGFSSNSEYRYLK